MQRFVSRSSTAAALSLAVAASRRTMVTGTPLRLSSAEAATPTSAATPTPTAAEQAALHEREAALRFAEDASKKNASMLERAAMLRREIHEIWAHPEDSWEEQQALVESIAKAKAEEAAAAGLTAADQQPILGKFPTVSPNLTRYEKQAVLARALLDKHSEIFSTTVARDEDVTRALGEAFERLLLMQVPLPDNGASTAHLQRVLDIAGKNGRELSVKVVQHLFSRCSCYPEAIALLYAMRYANINMSVDCYYAMIFSLQRLDEEAWCLRYREEVADKKKAAAAAAADGSSAASSSSKLSSSSHLGAPKHGIDAGVAGEFPLSAKALDFIVFGSDNQLLPESKPWIGRGIFNAEDEHAGLSATATGLSATPNAARRNTTRDFDTMASQWVRRLRDGQDVLKAKQSAAAPTAAQ